MKSGRFRGLLWALLLGAVLFTGGCSGMGSWFGNLFKSSPQEVDTSGDEMEMTREAMDYFNVGRYLLAEEIFQRIRDRYPFSPQATLAELRLADCKYYRMLYEEAIPLYVEFEKLHPNNDAIPYVIFMEGSCYYELMDTADRDQENTHRMIDTYQRLLNRYPHSPYTYEAKKRIKEGRNLLAEHELVVARWYARTDQHKQAVNRLHILLSMYPDTKWVKEAKQLLEDQSAYLTTENKTEEERVKAIMEPWYKKLWPF